MSRWSYRTAVVLVAATLLLIVFGGLVTSTGSALAVPDWPTTFGHNMFLYPWSEMVGGIFYEHSHRLIGSLVGLLTIALALLLWRSEPRWLRWLGLIAVALVVTQGVLGGLRVVLLADTLAVAHGALAQAFFAVAVALALFSSRGWQDEHCWSAPPSSLRWLGAIVTGVIYAQIVFGTLLTHWGRLDLHLAGVALLVFLVPALSHLVQHKHGERRDLAGAAKAMNILFTVQLFLGIGAYLVRFTSVALPLGSPASLALPVVHRLVAALLLGAALVLALRLFRLGAAKESSPAAFAGSPLQEAL